MRPAVAAIVPVLAAAVAIAGCGGSSGSSNGAKHASAGATIARAAFVSSAESGYRMTLAMTESLGPDGHLTASGSGSFSTAHKSGSLSMRMTLPGSAAALGSIATWMIVKGENLYMKLPSSLSAIIPGGKQWLAINLGRLGKVANLPGLGSLVQSEGSLSDPGQYLSYLKAISSSAVENLGTATVDGVKTTHYRAELDLDRLPGVVPAADKAATEQLVTKLKATSHAGNTPIDTWIDAGNRVRRIALSYELTIPVETGKPPQKVALNLTTDFTAYGPQPVLDTPPASQTEGLTSLLHGL